MLFKRLFTTSNPRLGYFPATRELDPKKLEFSPMQRRFEKYSSPYATAYPRAEAIPNSAPERRPYERIVAVRKLVRLSAKGKHMRFDSWCLAGDRNGSVGLAHATSTQASKATNLAMRRARNTMKHFELFEGRTLYHDIEFEFHGMRIRLMPKPKGYSVRAQRDIYEFCMSLGIKDLAAQIMVGSTNPMTISKAMMYALTYLHKKPSDVARLRGKPVDQV
jgi:small subunit ribosomal protein S5